MDDANLQKQAKQTFDTLCRMLDNKQWHYQKDVESYTINCGVQGDDLPMDISIEVDAQRQLIVLLSIIPFTVPEDARMDMAMAICAANAYIVDGSFDYDVTRGRIIFRMTSSFRDSLISEDLFEYMLVVSCNTIDDCNDKFLVACKKHMTVDELLEFFK